MCELLDFDIRCRGLASLTEDWKISQNEVSSDKIHALVWPLEELVHSYNSTLNMASQEIAALQKGDHDRLEQFIDVLKFFLPQAREVEALVIQSQVNQPEKAPEIAGLRDLSQGIEFLNRLIEQTHEESDWESLEKELPSPASFDAVAAFLRSTGQASK
jgi:hypothetical protein